MVARKVREFLDEHGVAYEVQQHPRAVTAQRLAAAEHVSGWDVAKPVLLLVGGQLTMVVVPGATEVDLEKTSEVLGHNRVDLAQERQFQDVFDDSEEGAEPPFGNLYGIPVFLDEKLRGRAHMVCRAGSHTETITLATDDYVRTVQPEIRDLSAAAR